MTATQQELDLAIYKLHKTMAKQAAANAAKNGVVVPKP
jgi:hypothetical protein